MSLLTIGIPTYNRGEILKATLNKILPICLQYEVEILVADDGSTDGTYEMLKQFESYKNFKIIKNSTNLGFDRNTVNLFNLAKSKFLWLFGDDDDLDIGQLKNILELLNSNKQVGLFYVDYRVLEEGAASLNSNTPLTYDEIDQQVYADRYLHFATFISTNIFNMDYYKKIKFNSDCISKEWIHFHVLLAYMHLLYKLGIKNIAIKDKVVRYRAGNSNYSFKRWEELFVDKIIFTLDHTETGNLRFQGFRRNFFRLNILQRFFKAGKDYTIGDCFRFYGSVLRKYRPAFYYKILFFFVTFMSKIFGYSTLKNIKMFFAKKK